MAIECIYKESGERYTAQWNQALEYWELSGPAGPWARYSDGAFRANFLADPLLVEAERKPERIESRSILAEITENQKRIIDGLNQLGRLLKLDWHQIETK